MSTKTYDQYCGIAAALDVIGDRWTILILRELSFGEQRFTDLRTGLPGIATNLLSERLRSLEDAGLVEQRELPAPAARMVYALTKTGRRINPVLRSLAEFGLPFLDEPLEGHVRPRMAIFGGLASLLDPVAAGGLDLRIRFDLDGEEHWLEVRQGRLVRADPTATPDLTFTGSAAALVELCRGATPEALGDRLLIEGSAEAREAFARCFLAKASRIMALR
ncbi:MAG: putative transcriptional regulator [Marmoricola sp.]|nr:putative transcriptional regulator [Marmoricola sp.]